MRTFFFFLYIYMLQILKGGCKLLTSTVANAFVRTWASWSENQVCSGALLARCYFEATENDCTIDQLKPGLKSVAQHFYVI